MKDEAGRRRVRRLLKNPSWRERSVNAIARRAGVSWGVAEDEVARAKARRPSLRSYVTKHGTRATMDVGKIGRHRAENALVRVPAKALVRALAHLPAAERKALLKALPQRDRRRLAAVATESV